MAPFSSSTRSRAARGGATLALALAAIAIGACGATPLHDPDGGAAGSAPFTPERGSGGSPDAGGAESASCTVVLASDYDQSCTEDADCLSVSQVPTCPVTDCSGCYLVGINKKEMARYTTALTQAFVREGPGPVCACPCQTGFALCRAGKCQAAACGPPRQDTLPACASAGGSCAYRANTTCGDVGPPASCAYADEVCCL